MALLALIQILCHHVLANEIVLKLKYHIGIKHLFNINLGIGIIKKFTFLFVFLTYIPVVLLKFWSGELVRCRIKLHIQWVPTRHNFDGTCYPKNNKYLKKRDDDPGSSPDWNLSKNIGRYVENMNKKVVFFYYTYPQIYNKKLFKTYTIFQI